jgi:hypothetical protein
MKCQSVVHCVEFTSLAGATNSTDCNLCQAGSYGSISGEWMWTGASRDGGGRKGFSCCYVKMSQLRCAKS